MKPKVVAMRALVAYVSLRALRLASILVGMALLTILALIWTLTYYFSPWWWFLLVPLSIVLGAVLIIRLIVRKIVHTIHRHPFTEVQRQQLEAFTAKLMRLAEAKSISLPIYALLTLRDIVLYRDAVTIRRLVEDSTSLTSDFRELTKYFGER